VAGAGLDSQRFPSFGNAGRFDTDVQYLGKRVMAGHAASAFLVQTN
jgi:hypothetical protein